MSAPRTRTAPRALVPLAVFGLTAAAFLPALRAGFVWDDDWVLVRNANIHGFSAAHLRWMLGFNEMPHYFPLTLSSFMLDFALWGLDPRVFHLTNVLLHALTAAAFFFLARRLLALAGPKPAPPGEPLALTLGAAFAALVFALHPLRAESVVYVTERCDPLSGFFFLSALLCHLKAGADPGGAGEKRRWRLLSLAAYALSLLSKEIGVTLPVTLLLLDVYPLRRWRPGAARRLLVEKLPYFALALASGLAAVFSQSSQNNLVPLQGHWAAIRLSLAVNAVAFYLSKTLCPVQLSPIYETAPLSSLLDPHTVSSALVLTLIGWLLVARRREWPWALAATVYYLVTLSPVSGLVRFGPQPIADRYSYLPCMGWAVLAGGGLAAACRSRARGRLSAGAFAAAAAAAAAVVLVLGVLAWDQAGVWRDQLSLCERALQVSPDSPWAEAAVGGALAQRGRTDEAIAHWRRALALDPSFVDVRVDISLALARQGRTQEAVAEFPPGLRLVPESATAAAYDAMGRALADHGDVRQALVFVEKAAAAQPDAAVYRDDLRGLRALAARAGARR